MHNASILQNQRFDITRTITVYPYIHISYESELRDAATLYPLLHLSPNWNEVFSSLTKGAKCPLERIINICRLTDIEDAIKRGNHKSPIAMAKVLKYLVSKDVDLGFQLPSTISSIKNTLVLHHTAIYRNKPSTSKATTYQNTAQPTTNNSGFPPNLRSTTDSKEKHS